jgi:FemAB-related protein (PEP-CTERM system-associated)
VNVVVLQDAQDESAWDQFVLSHPQASGYHTLAWRRVICNVFAHRTFYLMAKDDGGAVRGVLPLVLTKSPLFGCFLTSVAFFNYGGVLADSSEASARLLKEASELAQELKATHIEVRQTTPLATDWPVRSHKVSMRLALPSDYEVLQKAFPSKLRSQIRRAQKEGMDVRIGGEDLLDDYYQVFSRCMRDLGTPVYAKDFFRSIAATFPKDVRLCAVSLQGRPLAAGLVYGFRGTMEIPWAASDKRFSRLAPNMLLYGAVLEHACREGYREFDFGRSTVDSGTYRFKQQWGAQPHQLYWYYWLADDREVPQLNPENPKFKAAIALWQRLPLPMANAIGPSIVKYLP